MNSKEKIENTEVLNELSHHLAAKSKSLFTIASETYLHTFLEQKSKGLYDIIKDEDQLGNQLSPQKIKKEDLDLFLQRNSELLNRKKALANQQIEDSEASALKVKQHNAGIADNFYKSQMKRDEGKHLMIKEMAQSREKDMMSQCTFKPQIQELSRKIIQVKTDQIEHDKRINNLYVEDPKRVDVFKRLYNHDFKVQLARNLAVIPSASTKSQYRKKEIPKTNSKGRTANLMIKHKSYQKIGLKSQLSKESVKKLKISASKDNMSLSDPKFFRTNSVISRFSPTPINRVKTETAKSGSSPTSMQAKNVHSDLLLIQKLINEYESCASEEICTENEYFIVLQKMGFIKENEKKDPKSAVAVENELLAMQSFQIIFNSTMNSRSLSTIMKKNEDEASERSQYTITLFESIFSFLLCVSGYHVSSAQHMDSQSEFNGPLSTFDIKPYLAHLKSKKLQFSFNQFFLDGLCDLIRKKFSQLSKSRNDFINWKTKQKNEVKIIGIRQEIDSHLSSPQRSEIRSEKVIPTNNKSINSGRNKCFPKFSYQLQKGDAKIIQSRKKNS